MENVTIKYLLNTTGDVIFYDRAGYEINQYAINGTTYDRVSMLDNFAILNYEHTTACGSQILHIYVDITADDYRVCDECGTIFDAGFTDEFNYLCESCFDKKIEREYLTPLAECGENNGFWADTDGKDTGWYYTEWY